jgi:D-alanyl-D-alanine carboxypeptidase
MTTPRRQQKAAIPANTGIAAYLNGDDRGNFGLIVEAATGGSLATEIDRRIAAPLRLRATSLPSGPRIAGRHAHGYFLRPLLDVSVGSPSFDWAAGGLVSNADDLAGFFRALLGGRLLRPDLLRLMRTTVEAPQLGRGNAYGLGLQRVPVACGATWGHAGASPGYVTHALNDHAPEPTTRPTRHS